jgi:2-hydroxy-6-oxonona-2,4-dienedioate hydrolase
LGIFETIYEREGSDKHTAVVDGYRIRYLTAGDPSNPPLVFVHGWLMHAGFWRETMTVLKDRFYCIAVDLLGHGHSDKPQYVNYSIPAQAQHILQLLDQLQIDRFTVIGHSMGGQISLYLAAEMARDRVEKVVSVSGVTTGKVSRYMRMVVGPSVVMGAIFPRIWAISRYNVRYQWYRRIYCDKPLYASGVRSRYDDANVQMALVPGMERPALYCGLALMRFNVSCYLRQITAPTLVIFGADDNTVPVANGHVVRQHVTDCKLIIYDDCGHVPMIEAHDRFFTDLRDFLN